MGSVREFLGWKKLVEANTIQIVIGNNPSPEERMRQDKNKQKTQRGKNKLLAKNQENQNKINYK